MILVTGRIVNLSSALSRFSLPNRSTYGITKYGIQALSDCLRFEMKRWGISVSIIEPGSLVSGKKESIDFLEIMSEQSLIMILCCVKVISSCLFHVRGRRMVKLCDKVQYLCT
jgi:short-subunit dehydrogenase